MFLLEFFERVIRNSMEDPVERRQVWREYMWDKQKARENFKRELAQPTKTYKFWTSDRSNAMYHQHIDPGFKQLSGRTDHWQSREEQPTES